MKKRFKGKAEIERLIKDDYDIIIKCGGCGKIIGIKNNQNPIIGFRRKV
jgi:hypothetical protein